MDKQREGWGFPANSRKAHYFRGATSLCGRWLYAGRLDDEEMLDSPDNCANCQKRRRRELSQATPPAASTAG